MTTWQHGIKRSALFLETYCWHQFTDAEASDVVNWMQMQMQKESRPEQPRNRITFVRAKTARQELGGADHGSQNCS